MSGEDGNDILFAGNGDDLLYGGAGADDLHGDGGFDRIFGEQGADRLWGGAGADWFVFKGAGALDGGDRIQDFQDGSDRIVLEKLGVTKFAAGGGLGTVYAYAAASGDIILNVVSSAGAEFSVTVDNENGVLQPQHFSAADFIFV